MSTPQDDTALREEILEWYENLDIKPRQKDRLLTVTPTELMALISQKVAEAYDIGWKNGWAQRSKEEDYSAVIGKLKAMKPQDGAFFVIGEVERVIATLSTNNTSKEKK